MSRKCWLAIIVIFMVAGCSTGANVRKDMDLTGSLPRAIGLGAFAPACIMFCYVDSQTTQGNESKIPETDPGNFHQRTRTTTQIKTSNAKLKGKKP